MAYTEDIVILLILVLYQTVGHEKSKALLEVQKKATQKQVDTLNHIYGILPLIVMKANLKNNSIKLLNGSAKTILGEHEDHIKIAAL